MARLLSVNVGLPRDIEWKGRIVHTGIWKNPVHGRCRVGRLNLDGDGQGDLGGHGGEQRAVFVYQIESYRHWQQQLKRTDFVHGQFGENFTIEGLPDDTVCIGDRFQIGSALFEITQPRVTCYRVGIRTDEPRMPALLTSSGRPGFYFRVLREGMVGAGDEIVKMAEANERMTVAEINALLYSPHHARDRLQRALRIEALSPGWRASFEALLQTTGAGGGNAGLTPAAATHPVAPGFRPLAVAAINQESSDVLSLSMRDPGGQPLPPALPGQYVVLRLRRTAAEPPLFRSYSLSGPLSTERYRISVKIEPNGTAGTHLREHVRLGDVLDVSSPRGSVVLQSGERPVVFVASVGRAADPWPLVLRAAAGGHQEQAATPRPSAQTSHRARTPQVRQELLKYVEERRRRGKPLFYEPARAPGGKLANPQWQKVGERLGEWVRDSLRVTGVQPNHGWRHLWREIVRGTNMKPELCDYMCGHEGKSGTSARYGKRKVPVLAKEMSLFPRFQVPALNRAPAPHKRVRRTFAQIADDEAAKVARQARA